MGRELCRTRNLSQRGRALYSPTRSVCMRKRKDIEKDGKRKEDLIIEVLLDLRDILVKATKKKKRSV